MQDRGLALVQGLTPGPLTVQQELQGGEGIKPHLGLPGGEFLRHPVPDAVQFLERGVLPQVQVQERQDMGSQPHALQFAEELKIGLAQPHPGADDVERQVALHQVSQHLGQVLGGGRVAPLAVTQLHPLGRPGEGDGEEHVLEIDRGGLPGHQLPVPGQFRAREIQDSGSRHEVFEEVVAFQVGLEEEIVLVQAAVTPQVEALGLGQHLV